MGTKVKISHWLKQMRETVQAADVAPKRKVRLFALIDGLQAEVERACLRSSDLTGAEPTGSTSQQSPSAKPLLGKLLCRDRMFLTLATGMALGLFAQIGIIAHLYSLLVAALGTTQRWAMALLTLVAVVGRTYTGWFMPVYANRPG